MPQPARESARMMPANAVTLRVMINSVSRSANYTAPQAESRALRLTVPAAMAGLRPDQALAKLLPAEARSRLAERTEKGKGRVPGKLDAAKNKLKSGEPLEVGLAPRPQTR